MISLYHVSIRFLQYVQCYNTSNRVYRIVSIKLITLVFIYLFLCYLVMFVWKILSVITFSFYLQFVALRRWNRDGSRARPPSHEQENARGAHRLHPQRSDSGKFRKANCAHLKWGFDKRFVTLQFFDTVTAISPYFLRPLHSSFRFKAINVIYAWL